MPLTRKITKATYDSLTGANEWQKQAYKVDPGNANNYILDAEPDEDTGALQRAKEFEKAEKEKALGKVTELEGKLTQSAADLAEAKKGGKKDVKIEEVEAGWQTKFDNKVAELTDGATKAAAKAADFIKQNFAEALVAGRFTAPKLMLPEIMSRLEVDLSGDTPTVRILKDGKASPLTKDELIKEYVDSPDYAGIVNASFASGGGAGSNGGGNGGGAPKALKDMSEAERVALHKSNPAEFGRMVNEQNASAGAGQ